MSQGEPNIRTALAEHINAYADVLSSSTREWGGELTRRVTVFVVAAFFSLVTLLVGIFVAILASWNTPYRWWVVGGILLLCATGIAGGLYGALRAMRTRVAAPWTILADQVANDLRGAQGQPAPIQDEMAALRLQDTREQLLAQFAESGRLSGSGVKVGLGIATLVLSTLVQRQTRSLGGVGLALSLGMAALKLIRSRKGR